MPAEPAKILPAKKVGNQRVPHKSGSRSRNNSSSQYDEADRASPILQANLGGLGGLMPDLTTKHEQKIIENNENDPNLANVKNFTKQADKNLKNMPKHQAGHKNLVKNINQPR